MNISTIAVALVDNGGRRSGFDRRQFSYTNHIPERRSDLELDRRALPDRRRLVDRRHHAERRTSKSGWESFKNRMGLDCRRKKQERRSNRERRALFAANLALA